MSALPATRFAFEDRFAVAAPLDAVFTCLADPRQLDGLTPPWFRIVPVEPVPEPLGVGSEIRYRFRWHGLPLPWTSRIVRWEPPRRFAYEMKHGPYRRFVHDHRFAATPDGGTAVVDRFDYDVPGGALVARLLVEPDLRRIVRHRRARLQAVFGAGSERAG